MDDNYITKSFYIAPQHYEYLEQQNPNNVSHALRQILNEHQDQQQTKNNKTDLNKTFTYLSYTLLLFFISFILQPPINIAAQILSLIFLTLTVYITINERRKN